MTKSLMKPKTIKIIYWVSTILFVLANLFSGITSIMRTESGVELMKGLGYASYVLIILGLAKVLGSIALVQDKFRTLKEWAYAGFTFDILGASASFAFTMSPISAVLSPLIFLAVMFVSYFSWKKKLQWRKNGN